MFWVDLAMGGPASSLPLEWLRICIFHTQGLNCAAILSSMDRVDMAAGINPFRRRWGGKRANQDLCSPHFFKGSSFLTDSAMLPAWRFD